MRLDPVDAKGRFVNASVARLATVTADDTPHVVPICFVAIGDTLYSAVDDKPKARPDLRRLDNINAHAAAALLVDRYDDDWSLLWWVRADGTARVITDDGERADAVAALRAKYPQYASHALNGAVVAVAVTSWTGWAASGTRPAR